jgi:hypothetical protein
MSYLLFGIELGAQSATEGDKDSLPVVYTPTSIAAYLKRLDMAEKR